MKSNCKILKLFKSQDIVIKQNKNVYVGCFSIDNKNYIMYLNNDNKEWKLINAIYKKDKISIEKSKIVKSGKFSLDVNTSIDNLTNSIRKKMEKILNDNKIYFLYQMNACK